MRSFFFYFLLLLPLAACSTFNSSKPSPASNMKPVVRWVAKDVELDATQGKLWQPDNPPKGFIIMVPDVGDSSRDTPSNTNYQEEWAMALAEQDYEVLTYDNTATYNQYRSDVDKKGPVILAKDVDKACQFAADKGREHPILWSGTRGAAVLLSSACIQQAKEIVLVAPAPEGIDTTWVEGLRASAAALPPGKEKLQLINKADSVEEMFDSMAKKYFSADARIMGQTLSFWQSWIRLTQNTRKLLEKVQVPVLILLGGADTNLSEKSKNLIRSLGKGKNRRFWEIPAADHNLMHNGILQKETAGSVSKLLPPPLPSSHSIKKP